MERAAFARDAGSTRRVVPPGRPLLIVPAIPAAARWLLSAVLLGSLPALMSLRIVLAGEASRTWSGSGWVSDAKCGKNVDPDCNRRCLAQGEAPVLVVDGSDEVLAISNPETLIGHPGEHLFVTGIREGSGLTIRSVKVPHCSRRDPQGSYQGTVVSREAGTLDVSMNLACVGGRYSGELRTPVGLYTIVGGSVEAGRARLQFAGGGGVGSLEAQVAGDALRGDFRFSDDSGPVDLRRTGEATPPLPGRPALGLTPEQWREDLAFFARELPKRHANAFHHTSRERFETEVADLDRRLDHLDSDAIYVGMDRIANLIGDGHTYVQFPPDTADFPLRLGRFGDDLRVAAVLPGFEKALGTRVLEVQDLPVARAAELVAQVTPQDENPELAEGRISEYLTLGIVLHGLGITPDRGAARYTLENAPGERFTLEVRAGAAGKGWILPFEDHRLRTRNPEESFWTTYLPEARTIYCNFRGYHDLGKYAKAMMEMVRGKQPEKLVIDLRQNGGGDYKEGLKYLIEPIRDLPAVNRKGHLFVLIGPDTFSAAMSNAAQFRSLTAAILVGRTIGEKPNSYQEAREMSLPNSHLKVRYSTRYYQFVESGENAVRPDQEVLASWEDFKAGRDPALEWVLSYPAEGGKGAQSPSAGDRDAFPSPAPGDGGADPGEGP